MERKTKRENPGSFSFIEDSEIPRKRLRVEYLDEASNKDITIEDLSHQQTIVEETCSQGTFVTETPGKTLNIGRVPGVRSSSIGKGISNKALNKQTNVAERFATETPRKQRNIERFSSPVATVTKKQMRCTANVDKNMATHKRFNPLTLTNVDGGKGEDEVEQVLKSMKDCLEGFSKVLKAKDKENIPPSNPPAPPPQETQGSSSLTNSIPTTPQPSTPSPSSNAASNIGEKYSSLIAGINRNKINVTVLCPPPTPAPLPGSSKSVSETSLKREKVVKDLQEALATRQSDATDKYLSKRSTKDLHNIGKKIEKYLFRQFEDVSKKYLAKYRSIVQNIKNPQNQVLFRQIIQSKISPRELVAMNTNDYAKVFSKVSSI